MRRAPVVPLAFLLLFVLASCRDTTTEPETAPGDEAAQTSPEARPDEAVPNRYLVIFRKDMPDVAVAARALAASHGMTIRHIYRNAVLGFAADLPPSGQHAVLEALQRNPNVRYVEQDRLLFLDSDAVSAAGPPTMAPPAAPSNLSALAQSGSEIALSWTDNSNDERGFQVLRCEGAGCSGYSEVSTTKRNATAFTDSGLSPGMTYCYEVKAFGRTRGNVEYSAPAGPVCATTEAPAPSTDPPTGLSATATGTTSVDLSWTDNSDETAFEIERCLGTGCSSFAPLAQTAADVAVYTDGTLSADVTACYRVRGDVGGTPTGWSNTSCATTDPVPPSTGRFVEDDFDDAAGTQLEAHVGVTGASWTPHPSSAANATIGPNGSEVQSSNEAVYGASGSPPGSDYRVAAHIYFYRAASGSVRYSFVAGRMDETTRTMYMFGYVYAGVNRWELKKFVNGTETLLAYSTQALPAAGDAPLVDLQMEGSTIRGVVDGVELVSATDTEIPAAGRAGLRMYSGNADYAALADFEATTLDLAPPPPAPATDPPSNFMAAVLTSTSVGLSWTDNSDEDAFDIERCEGSGCSSFTFLVKVGRDVTSYVDSGLTSDVDVCYRVRGIVGATPTGWSNTDCALPESVPDRFVEDAFEDVPGTVLQAHTGAVGASWTRHPSSVADATFASTGGEIQSTAEAAYTASGPPPGPDYRVASWLSFHTPADNAVAYTFVTGRMDEAARTMYMFGYVYAGVNRWELKKFVNGTETLLGFSTERLPQAGGTRLVDLQMEGSTIRGVVNGYELVSVVDTDITGPGRAGLRLRSGNLAYAGLTDLEATVLSLAPPPIPPLSDPPSDLTATAITSTNVVLSWTDNSEEETFEVERCEGTGCSGFALVAQLDPNLESYLDSGLTPDLETCYRVRGIVVGNPTDYSNVACATPTAPPPGTCPDTGNHDDLAQLWGITRTGADQNPAWRGTQNGGECAIQGWYFGIDSGVDIDHPDLNVVEAIDFLGDGSGGDDGHGHGTHTAGTAAAIDGNGGVVGMAPGAPVFGFKVCGDDGSCDLAAIVAAIDEVTGRKLANPSQPMVANMSLGGEASPTMEEAVRRSVAVGVPYALAAGNGIFGACLFAADAANFSPALVGDDQITPSGGTLGNDRPLNGAITTTSSDQNDTDVNCNYGAPVTVAAPGVGILSTWKNGGYNTISGTSMATPHVAGAVLLYLQHHPDATPEQIETAIVALLAPWTTDDLPNATGRLNAGGL